MGDTQASPSNERDVMPIRLYDTRTRTVRPFQPLRAPSVGVYSCGPTVYAPQHLGNMRSQLLPDLLCRVLTAAGHEVTFVVNITDVGHLIADRDDTEDKMELAAARTGETAEQIAARYTEQWQIDRRRLGCLEPDHLPRAASHIDEQIELIRILEARGHTYQVADGVYFDVSTFPRYAEFAGLELQAQATTGRIDGLDFKRNAADFALWKLTPPDVQRQQEWDSPWGRGFPGWHIECSAMATRYLGPNFDIHTGGVDHVRVHHTNEIAQSECALDQQPWVGYWLHNEFLDLSGRKISKSEGDALLVDTLIERGIDPLAFRYFFFQAHYRQQQQFTWEAVEAAAAAHARLVDAAVACRDHDPGDPVNRDAVAAFLDRFWRALADDLNAPQALAVVWQAIRDGDLGPAERWLFLSDVDRALGFGLADVGDRRADQTGSDTRIDELVARRHTARQEKDFATSDRIRDELVAEGIELVDTADGTRWRRTAAPLAPS